MADISRLGITDVNKESEEFFSSADILPPGWHVVRIIKEEFKDTKTGGKMLVFDYQTESGSTIKDRINIVNASEAAVRIGKAALGKIAQSIGINGALMSTDVLFGRPFEIKVIVDSFKNDKGEDIPKNDIKDYRAVQAKVNTKPASTDGW